MNAGRASSPRQPPYPLRSGLVHAARPLPADNGQFHTGPPLLVDLHDERGQLLIIHSGCRRCTFLPREIALPGYLQQLAHENDREPFRAWLALVPSTMSATKANFSDSPSQTTFPIFR